MIAAQLFRQIEIEVLKKRKFTFNVEVRNSGGT